MSSPAAIPSNTTTTQNTNSVPEFLQPNVSTLLGAAGAQVYQQDGSGGVTGMQPYVPYSTNGADYVAPMTDLQKQAQASAAALQVPGQIAQGSGIAGNAAYEASNAGAQSANIGNYAIGVGSQGTAYGDQAMAIGNQAANAGNAYNAQATDPNSISQFMSPYMQNVVDYQTQEANRQYDITGTQQRGAATSAGAMGGSREAIMAAENERNRNTAITGIQATGAQTAYQQAQQAQQFGANLGVQGAGVGIQGANAGISGVNTALTGTSQGLQGQNQAISAAGQEVGAAQTLGQLGSTQLAGQQSIIETQAKQGAVQQGQQQAAIEAAVANQQKAQLYPQEQLSYMSSLIRGIPTQTSSSVYAAQPTTTSQVLSGLGSAASLYGAAQSGKKKGGIIDLDRSQYYDVGGAVEADLYDMTPQQLQQVIQEATSATERSMAKRILAEKSMARGGIVAFANGDEVPETDTGTDRVYTADETAQLPNDFLSNPPRVPAAAPVAPIEATPKKADLKKPTKKHQFFNTLEDDNKLPVGTLSIVHGLESSSGTDLKKSKAGAEGQFQFMPDTAKQYGVKDVNDLEQSATGAAKYLGDLSDRYGGDIGLAAAAYNWGPANVDKWQKTGTGIHGQPMPKETINYMNTVKAKLGMPQTGIAQITQPVEQAAPQDEPAPDAPAPQIQPAEASQGRGIDMLNAQTPALQAEANKSTEQIMAEQQKIREDAGVGTNEATQQYRSEMMAERANAPAERERQAYLRAAEFFAHWGSTPGPVLAAGLTALKETMPGYLEDIKDQKKLKHELDRGLFDMNQADRLEKLGFLKQAADIKERASSRIQEHGNLIAKAYLAKEEELSKQQSQEKVAAEGNTSRIEAAGIRAQNAGASTTHLRQDLVFKMKTVDKDIKDTLDVLGKPPKVGSPKYDTYSKLLAKRNAIVSQVDALGRAPASAQPQEAAGGLTVGQVVDGHTYQGGDPNDEANWVEE